MLYFLCTELPIYGIINNVREIN
ncbi:hypothetical protein, partial [Bacillus subtilis]